MPITSATMTSTLLASTPVASTPMAPTSVTFVPMTSTPLASVPMTSTSNAPTSLTFSQVASTLLASTTMASCTPITLYGSPPPLQSIHPTNLSMPYSPFVYAPLPFGTLPTHSTCQKTPFWLVFIKGNISRCAGCGQHNLRNTDGSVREPPDDICMQHKEHVIFENPHTGCHQMSSNLRNVYYHAFQRCVVRKHHDFYAPNDLKIAGEVKCKLTSIHFMHLKNEFGLAM